MAIQNSRPCSFTQLTTQGEWESIFHAAGIVDGVDGSSSLVPTLDVGGRNAVVSAGLALIKGQMWSTDAPISTPIAGPSGSDRIDRLVLRYNRAAGTAATVVSLVIIQGTPASSPTEPALIRTTSGNWDIPISRWLSASNGTVSGLIDERQFAGDGVATGTSAYRPPVTDPTLYVETDTGRLQLWNGSAWRNVGPPDGPWASNQIGNGNWNASGSWNTYTNAQWPPIFFTAPPSGKVFITVGGSLFPNSNTQIMHMGWWMYSAPDGTGNYIPPDNKGAIGCLGGGIQASRRQLVTGLAPGGNCELHPAWWITTANQGHDGYTDGTLLVEAIL